MTILKDIYKNYGITNSHTKFVNEFKYLNTLAYSFLITKNEIEQNLKEKVIDAKRSSKDGIFALGMVTNPISKSSFEAILIPGDEAETISNNIEGFLELIIKHSIVAAHRCILEYCLDILIELNTSRKINLSEKDKERINEKRLRPEEISKLIKLYVVDLANDSINIKLRWLGELRNILEHNNGICTETYVKVKDIDESINIGDKVVLDLKKLGYAFAAIAYTEKLIEEKVKEQLYQ